MNNLKNHVSFPPYSSTLPLSIIDPTRYIRILAQYRKHSHASLLAPAEFEGHVGSYQPQLVPENITATNYQTIHRGADKNNLEINKR